MTKQEARKINSLQIHPNGTIEDCFYLKMALEGRISDEQGANALARLTKADLDDDELRDSLILADTMIENLDNYGVACIDWM